MSMEKFTENLIYSQVFSFEVLNYYDSISTKENINWIIKYFNLLIKNENINSEKFDIHHIIPCSLFKDKNHKTRKETEKLANDINGNKIKLSYKNHIIAHYFLWKIFPNNEDTRRPIYFMLNKLDFKHLTENEIIKFAEIQEECKKANMTKEERKEQLKESKKTYRQNNHKPIAEYNADYRLLPCFDPIIGDCCTQHTLEARIYRHKDLYENITVKNCLIKDDVLINEFKMSKNILENERWKIIQNSNIDFRKQGWATELSKLFGISYLDCGIYVKRHYPDFYKTCYLY